MTTELPRYFLLTLFALSLIGCKADKVDLLDHYKIYRYAEFNTLTRESTSDKQVLMCKLGGGTDPYVPNVKTIEYNSKYMVVNSSSGFYLIDGKGKDLCCMCGDLTKGPLTQSQMAAVKDSLGFKHTKYVNVAKLMK